MPESPDAPKRKAPRRRPALGTTSRGPVRKAVHAALEEARTAERMTLEHEVRALVALRLADLVDRAATDSDGPAFVRVSAELLEVLDTLPVRPAGGGDGDDRGAARGHLIRLMDSGPTMGDTSQP